MRNDRSRDGGAGHQGRADLELFAVADGEDLVDHDFLAYVRSNLFYFDFLASSNTILFAAGFYDRVHINLLGRKFPQKNFRGTSDYIQQPLFRARPRTATRSRANALSIILRDRSGFRAGPCSTDRTP
jgi:hypothetical protein